MFFLNNITVSLNDLKCYFNLSAQHLFPNGEFHSKLKKILPQQQQQQNYDQRNDKKCFKTVIDKVSTMKKNIILSYNFYSYNHWIHLLHFTIDYDIVNF